MQNAMGEGAAPFMVRQGDVLVMAAGDLEKRARDWKEAPRDEVGRVMLAAGKATGHHHAIVHADVRLMRTEGVADGLLVVDTDDAKLVHEEHAAIAIPRGRYAVRNQREWTGAISQQVID